MDATIEKRVNALSDSIVNVGKHIDEVVKWLDDNKRNFAPKTPSEPLQPLFVEALKNISGAEYRLECAEIARYEHERRDSGNS